MEEKVISEWQSALTGARRAETSLLACLLMLFHLLPVVLIFPFSDHQAWHAVIQCQDVCGVNLMGLFAILKQNGRFVCF